MILVGTFIYFNGIILWIAIFSELTIFYYHRGIDKALYCLKDKKYEEIIACCNDEIQSAVAVSPEIENIDENLIKLDASNDSEDEGISADDSQKDSQTDNGSGDGAQIDVR